MELFELSVECKTFRNIAYDFPLSAWLGVVVLKNSIFVSALMNAWVITRRFTLAVQISRTFAYNHTQDNHSDNISGIQTRAIAYSDSKHFYDGLRFGKGYLKSISVISRVFTTVVSTVLESCLLCRQFYFEFLREWVLLIWAFYKAIFCQTSKADIPKTIVTYRTNLRGEFPRYRNLKQLHLWTHTNI
jgi:hypothetical protein